MEVETVETTSETTTENTISADGRTVTETVTTTSDVPVVRHCECDECQQWEQDIADHIAYLTERLDRLEEPEDTGVRMPEGGATETIVEQPPPEKADEATKTEPVKPSAEAPSEAPPAKKKRRHAGFFF